MLPLYCNVSTSTRSRWAEEMQCEMPWADGELMKPWCKCYVASQPIFLHHHSPAELKKTHPGRKHHIYKISRLFAHFHPLAPHPPHWMFSYPASMSANHPHQNSLSLKYLNSLVKTNLPFAACLMCVSDSCHLTPRLIRPVSLVSTFPACSPHPGAHRLASSTSST